MKLKKLLERYPEFYNELDSNLKLFAREIKKELRDEGHVIIAITGYPNSGKSNMAAILGMLIDEDYDFDINICFIPTAKEIESRYMNLNMYSYLHIDEASRSLHKHKWYERVQQKLNELYDTEREGHFLCTALLMPRFQNFTENFRNFMIKYWVNLPVKGLAVFYKRDEDKDCKDPWHIEENYKKKKIRFKSKRVFERALPDQIRAEQITDCYWFYCKVPPVPKDVWSIYQQLKKESRVIAKDQMVEVENYKDRITREKEERWSKIRQLKSDGKTHTEIAAIIGCSSETIRKNLRDMEAVDRLRGVNVQMKESNNIIFNHIELPKTNETKLEDRREQKAIQQNESVE
jgi:hypothetical protein